jgi:ubiquinone/menaquinone biosynthesis C-methylase UbiE
VADWTDTFFTGFWSLLQERSFSPAETEEQARFVRRALGLRKGSRLLDVPCGDGRIALELARAGVQVTGVDRCAESVRRARRRFRAAGLTGRFEIGDMRALEVDGGFHAVVNWWGSFGYYDDEANLAILTGFAERVVRGGRVLVHQVNRERVLRDFRHRMSADYGGVKIETRNRWDPVAERIEGRWTITSGRRSEKRRSSMRVYTRAQMERLMRAAGLTRVRFYGDADGRPYDRGTRWMATVGARPR